MWSESVFKRLKERLALAYHILDIWYNQFKMDFVSRQETAVHSHWSYSIPSGLLAANCDKTGGEIFPVNLCVSWKHLICLEYMVYLHYVEHIA